MNKFLKVEGHDSLVRDMSSKAIIATNETDYEAYKRSREKAIRQHQTIAKQNEEIQSLKSEIQEIKQMISLLIKGK